MASDKREEKKIENDDKLALKDLTRAKELIEGVFYSGKVYGPDRAINQIKEAKQLIEDAKKHNAKVKARASALLRRFTKMKKGVRTDPMYLTSGEKEIITVSQKLHAHLGILSSYTDTVIASIETFSLHGSSDTYYPNVANNIIVRNIMPELQRIINALTDLMVLEDRMERQM